MGDPELLLLLYLLLLLLLFVVEFVVTPIPPVCCCVELLSSVSGRPGEPFSPTGLTTVPILLMYGPFSGAGIYFFCVKNF